LGRAVAGDGRLLELDMARALIIGISGQDGAYLARLLDARGVKVCGTTRSAGTPAALAGLGIAAAVTVRHLPDPGDASAIAALLDAEQPDEIYHLAGFHAAAGVPGEPGDGSVCAIAPWLDALRDARGTRLFAAVSAAIFGDGNGAPVNVATAFAPQTTYAIASAAVARDIAQARDEGIFAVAGMMFAHESRFASPQSLAQHIIAAVHAHARGEALALRFANPAAGIDIGWAPEYVDAMTRMLRADTPADQVVATGTLIGPGDIARWAGDFFKTDTRALVGAGVSTLTGLRGDPAGAATTLGWRANTVGRDLIETLCEGYAAAQPR
jgi:GDPmannose 4,6-dehydratase